MADEVLREAAWQVLRATDANLAALNGDGHPGTPHDRVLHRLLRGDIQIFDAVGDCSACGGAQYGAEDDLQRAIVRLRIAVGDPLKPWEFLP